MYLPSLRSWPLEVSQVFHYLASYLLIDRLKQAVNMFDSGVPGPLLFTTCKASAERIRDHQKKKDVSTSEALQLASTQLSLLYGDHSTPNPPTSFPPIPGADSSIDVETMSFSPAASTQLVEPMESFAPAAEVPASTSNVHASSTSPPPFIKVIHGQLFMRWVID